MIDIELKYKIDQFKKENADLYLKDPMVHGMIQRLEMGVDPLFAFFELLKFTSERIKENTKLYESLVYVDMVTKSVLDIYKIPKPKND